MGAVAKGAIQVGAYSLISGYISVATGGDFKSGAIGGAAGSFVGSLTAGLGPGLQIGASALMGGVGAEMAGGDFWRGAAVGGIVVGANHLLHGDPPTKRIKAKDFFPSREPYEGFSGGLEYFMTGGIESGISYDKHGNPLGFAPHAGAPDFIGGGIKGGVGLLSKMGHIFRNAKGHVNPSTASSKARFIRLFEKVTSNPSNVNNNVLSNYQKSAMGFQGFSQVFRSGRQVWYSLINCYLFTITFFVMNMSPAFKTVK